jgi:2',3'-cyclic-nucleotide 2'-phosphodiesterase (5'-nucleotidase family)
MHQRRRVVSLIAASPLVGLAGVRRALAAPTTITILHCNDVYLLDPVKGQGGFAPFMNLLRQERARNPASITTFGGDLLSPSILSGLTKGRQMIEVTNAIGIEVAVLGNHEFDFGPAVAEERVRESRFPWLGTNVLAADGKPAVGAGDLWLKEVGGYRIGFFGLLTPETTTLSQPGPQISFAPPRAVAEAAVKQLRGMGADLVVALTHLDLAEDRALAADVDGIDLILGGHDHDPITVYEGGKLILKAGYDLHYLAAIDLTLERATVKDQEVVLWRPAWRYLPTAGVAPDPEIQAVIDRWNATLDRELAEPVGRTAVELDTRRSAIRAGESNFGGLLADALRSATGADVALTNAGGIRGDRTYPAGTVLTRKDILTELPFGNVTVLVELKGADLLAALENGVSQVEEGAGRFPQVSGLTFAYDPTRPPGSRIVEVKVGGQPLDLGRTYRLATNDYLLGGGDGYAVLRQAKPIIDPSAGTLMASTLINYITALGGEVAPATDGRIVRR